MMPPWSLTGFRKCSGVDGDYVLSRLCWSFSSLCCLLVAAHFFLSFMRLDENARFAQRMVWERGAGTTKQRLCTLGPPGTAGRDGAPPKRIRRYREGTISTSFAWAALQLHRENVPGFGEAYARFCHGEDEVLVRSMSTPYVLCL